MYYSAEKSGIRYRIPESKVEEYRAMGYQCKEIRRPEIKKQAPKAAHKEKNKDI